MAENRTSQWLEALAGSDTSTEEDSRMMQRLLRQLGFPRAVVTYGVAYLEGRGRADSIQAMARHLSEAIEQEQTRVTRYLAADKAVTNA